MSVLHPAGLNKKAVSDIIVAVIMIVIVVIAIMTFWFAMRKMVSTSPKIDCVDLISSFSLKKTCYLNENEIKVELKRGFDDINIERLKFGFSGAGNYIWEITGKKCSDIRIGENYGGYCDIINPGQTISYVFDFTGLDKVDVLKFGGGIDELCSISEISVSESC